MDFYWHVPHGSRHAWRHFPYDRLLEPLDGVPLEAIVAFINGLHRPDRELYLRLMKPVEGPLPSEYVEAWKTFLSAWKGYEPATDALVYNEALRGFGAKLMSWQPEIEAIHEKECPGCDWVKSNAFAVGWGSGYVSSKQ